MKWALDRHINNRVCIKDDTPNDTPKECYQLSKDDSSCTELNEHLDKQQTSMLENPAGERKLHDNNNDEIRAVGHED